MKYVAIIGKTGNGYAARGIPTRWGHEFSLQVLGQRR